ncbi:MAG: S8 family serine peptidase [Trueperaceae bacterium]|nr:S8 family serine peptidase [Trueperaceae bacterium]
MHRQRKTLDQVRLCSIALILAVSACVTQPPPEVTPDLSVTPTSLEGVTRATAQVQASGAWTLSVSSDNPALAANTSLSRTSGSGSATVAIHIDPTGIAPARYRLTLRLIVETQDGLEVLTRDVAFAFPRVYGTVVVHDALATFAALEADLAPTIANAVHNPDGTVTLIVSVDRALAVTTEGVRASTNLDALANHSVTLDFPAAGVVIIDVPASEAQATIDRLSATAGVRAVAPSIELEQHQLGFPNDFHYPRQWGFGSVGMETAWELARGAGVTIAIIDGGFYPAHPDLSSKVVGQYDFGDNRTDVTATHAVCGTHGTHVAGIAAAATNNVIGVAGAAPAAGLLLLDIDKYDGVRCPMTTAALVAALEYVYNGGNPRAQVVNMSLGAATSLGQGVRDALDTLYVAGVALVASSGNDDRICPSSTTSPVSYPAAYDSVMAIGATRPDDARACYSQVGPELFLVAPGGEQWYAPTDVDMIFSTVYDAPSGVAEYGYMQGTSMSSPLVAGVIALMMEAAPDASLFDIEQALSDTAIDLGSVGRDEEYGYGLIDPTAAIAALSGSEPPPPDPLGLILDVDRYPLTPLGHHREFILVDSVTGPVSIQVYSDDDENGVPGESGEYLGSAALNVEFDKHNAVTVHVYRQ